MHGPRIVVGLLLLIAVLLLPACGGTSPQPAEATATSVTSSSEPTATTAGASNAQGKFTSDEGGFSAAFPGNPNETTNTASTDVGQVDVHTFSYADSSGVGYNVAYSDYPADKVQADSEQLLNGAVSGIGNTNKILSQQTTTQQGHPAVTAEFDAAGTSHLFYKGVIVKNRLYQIVVAAPSADADTDKADAMKFIDSFELTNP